LVELRSVVEDRKSLDPAKIAGDDNKSRRGGQSAIVRRRKLHLQLGPDGLFFTEIFHDLVFEVLIRDDNEMPGLRVCPRRRVERRFEYHVSVIVYKHYT